MSRYRLDIDFLPRRRFRLTPTGAGLALLAALVWVLAISTTHRGADPRTPPEPSAAARGPALTLPAGEPVGRWSPAQAAALTSVVRGLELPWSALMDRTARAAPAGVSLLAFEPDVAQSMLTLQGEAERPAVMVRYLQALERDAHLGQALLRDFESVPESSRVRFTIAASMGSVMQGGRR
jgi:hypothetical protein